MIFSLRLPRVFSTSLFLQDKSFSCSEHKFAKSITPQDKLFRANTKTLFLSGLFALVKNGSSWQPPGILYTVPAPDGEGTVHRVQSRFGPVIRGHRFWQPRGSIRPVSFSEHPSLLNLSSFSSQPLNW
jgi:hypothetical protein